MSNGSTSAGSITQGDLDPYSFSATQGDAVLLSVGQVGSSTLRPWIRLVSPTGTITETVGDAQNSAARISVTAPTTGTYIVIVGSDWGSSSFNRYGGAGNYELAVGAPANFTALTAGVDYTCGLTSAGAAYCWGDNNLGQLGDGTTVSRLTPTAVIRP